MASESVSDILLEASDSLRKRAEALREATETECECTSDSINTNFNNSYCSIVCSSSKYEETFA